MASGRVTHLILDFDGLILDTETPDFISWRDEYSAHGVDLDGDRWLECIGSTGWFDLYEELEALVGGPIDRVAVRDSRRRRYSELVIEQRPMPGVETLLDEAADAGIPVGVASSSTTGWVMEHLHSHGLADRVEAVCGRDEVEGIAKPAPDVYLEVARRIGACREGTVAFEDTPNGVRAARAAEIWSVYVPGPMTSHLECPEAHLRLRSVGDVALNDLLGAVSRRT